MDLLANYSSDSDNELNESSNGSTDIIKQNPQRLPLPGCLLNNLKKEDVVDDPSLNEGRVRSFPHQRGNWASHVFIQYKGEDDILLLCEKLMEVSNECGEEMRPVSSPHVSLTRTFILLYHWIQGFVSTVKTAMSSLHCFRLELRDIDVYVNDEKTRTFLGLTVASGCNHLAEAVGLLDSCLDQYNLKPFYEDGRFHMSVCWCLGDRRQYFTSIMPELRQTVAAFFHDYPETSFMDVTQLLCKIGNRSYTFDLVS